MYALENKVAVITGAGSGFGRELALLYAEAGMRLVLADIDPDRLEETRALLSSSPDMVLVARTDVGEGADVQYLSERAYEQFGAVHLLINNAGIVRSGYVWETPFKDWQQLLRVNLWGVVHGIRCFVPRMLKQAGDSHVVNVASLAGILPTAGLGAYSVTKHGVVAISECLYHELQLIGGRIGVTLVCPGFTPTNLTEGMAAQGGQSDRVPPVNRIMLDAMERSPVTPKEVAQMTLDAVRNKRFYVLTHAKGVPVIAARMQAIVQQSTPVNALQPPPRNEFAHG